MLGIANSLWRRYSPLQEAPRTFSISGRLADCPSHLCCWFCACGGRAEHGVDHNRTHHHWNGSRGSIPGVSILSRVLILRKFLPTPSRVLSYVAIYASPSPRRRSCGLIAGQWAFRIAVRPLVGAAFAENIHATWRWVSILIGSCSIAGMVS